MQPDAADMPITLRTSPRCDTPRPRAGTPWLFAVLPLFTLAAACDKTETPTSATDTTTATVAEASITEEFSGTLPVGGHRFYSFTVGANGTVNVTLTSVGGAGVPSTVWLGIGLGTPSGEDCATTSSVNAAAAATAQLTATYAPGIYCAQLTDIGNLYAPAAFTATIAHP